MFKTILQDACEQINERLKSIKESNPSRSWEDVVSLPRKLITKLI